MNKKIKTLTTILLILTIIPTATILADNEFVKVTSSSLIARYMQNSSQSERISLNAEKQVLDNYTIINSISELEHQIKSNNNNISKLESGQGSGTLTEQQYQADYQRIYGYELEMKMELYKMHEKLDLFYADYSEKITEHQKKQLELEIYTLLWSINSKQSERDYLDGLTHQKEHELSVMGAAHKLGYATENDVLKAEAEFEQTKAQLIACENEYDILIRKYEIGANEKLKQVAVEYSETAYSVERVFKDFEKNSFYSEYYNKQATAYQAYSEALEKMEKEMPSSMYNKEYFKRVQEYIRAEAAYYRNEEAISQNSEKRYSEELELFVYEICGNVNSLTAQRKATAAALKAAENQLEISRVLLDEGRINETALMEVENNVLKLKAELAKVEAEIMCKKFVIDNKIENFNY